jgi:2-deoxy-D-gluconate 3-dehydrogenase
MATQSIQELISLNSKTAIITGGSVGIGQGIVRRLHEAGANTVIVDKDKAGADSLAQELNQVRANSALAVAADVSLNSDVQAVVAATKDRFESIDILVNNAGIFPFATLNDLTEDTFDSIVAVNLKGVYLTTKQVSEVMKIQGNGGRIINITSIDAIHPSMAGLAAYDASKHGVWGYTKNIALELAKDKIYVNALAPGGVNTPGVAKMSGGTVDTESFAKTVPMGRMGEPDDIARATLFLASDLASYVTGAQLVVDGGALLT